MKKISCLIGGWLVGGCLGIFGMVVAQDPSPEPSAGSVTTPATAPGTSRKAPTTRRAYPPRLLQPHVFRTINPYLDMMNLTNIHDIEAVASQSEEYDWARAISFRSKVWYLELEVKPMRVMTVDLPGRDGKLQRRAVWYLLYKVRNPGQVFVSKPKSLDADTTALLEKLQEAGTHPLLDERHYYEIGTSKEDLRFIPIFELQTYDAYVMDPATRKEKAANRRYIDRFLPIAVQAVKQREDRGRNILDSAQMSNRVIRPGEEVWGVAVWSGVNPTVDRFSVYVSGLTNARKWFPDESDPSKGVYKYKVLKLNYWRPGDESPLGQNSRSLKMGAPGVLDYEWIFR
ncbi:MAG: hypothetical protein Q4D62_10285 [Planctomycetia bacterium]|nr:hypothetical protein [Planctomycetia bacterium]